MLASNGRKLLWKIEHGALPEPVFIQAATENEAKITWMDNFFGSEKALHFVNDSSFKISAATLEDFPEQFTTDKCLGYDF